MRIIKILKSSVILHLNYWKDNIVTYRAEISGIWYQMVSLNGKECIGNYMYNHYIYIDDGIIYISE